MLTLDCCSSSQLRMQILTGKMSTSMAFGTTITQLLELVTAELGAGLVVTHFLWELIPTWNFSACEKSPAACVCCV